MLQERTDLLLHGHQHGPVVDARADTGESLRVLATGRLYEADGEEQGPVEFHVVDVTLTAQGRPLWYDLEAFAWSGKQWRRASAIYAEATDGVYRWWTEAGLEWEAEYGGQERQPSLQATGTPDRV